MITLDKIQQLHDLREELDPEIIEICEDLLNYSYRNAHIESYEIRIYKDTYLIDCYGTETRMGHSEEFFESYPIKLFINNSHETLKDYATKQIEDAKRRQKESDEEARTKSEMCEKAILRNLLKKYPEVQKE